MRRLNKLLIGIIIVISVLGASWIIVGKITAFELHVTTDENGIVLVDYGIIKNVDIGVQRNPVVSGQKALQFYNDYLKTGNETSKNFLINNADWLLSSAQKKDNYLIFEYDFPWPPYDLPPNWHDAMAQSRAIHVLLKTHEVTSEQKYLDGAKLLLNAFFVEVKDGGVTYKSENGWWYEHYAHKDGKSPRVLNAHIISMLEIHEYYKYTNDTDAKFLFEQGLTSVKNELNNYDLNGYSYYNVLGKPSSIKYHDMHIRLTQQLYEITNEKVINEYHEKWKNCNDFCKIWEKNLANIKRLPKTLEPYFSNASMTG